MKTHKWLLLGVFVFLAALLLGGNWLVEASPLGAPPSVDPSLQAVLDAEGKADLFIEFSARADLSRAEGLSWEEKGEYVYNRLQRTADLSQDQVRSFLGGRRIEFKSYIINNTIYIPGATQELLDELSGFRGINRFYLEEIFRVPDLVPVITEDSINAVEWGIAKVHANDAWAQGYRGQGMVVANVDTGVRYTHNALVNQYRGNNGNGTYTHTYSWYDPTNTYPSSPGDNNGHGTHTMGTMVGDDGGSNQIGVAPGAEWIACKGCSSSSCASNHLLSCFDWMLAPGNDTNQRPNVVNNSWGGCSYSTTYKTAIQNLRSSGIYPVFSNGNTSNCGYSAPFCGSVGSPGTYVEVTGVGATDSNDSIASFSLWGPSQDPAGGSEIKPEVSAPGASIRSSYRYTDSNYATMSGTSMAAPHVSGALAVIWSACPALLGDFEASEQLLENTALKIAYNTGCGNEGPGNIPNNAFGNGRIDVQAAISACLGSPQPTPTATPTATAVVSPTATPIPTATNTPQPGGEMHVGDLDNESTSSRNRWNAIVRITVHDASDQPVVGALVTGSWSSGTTGTSTCTTDSSGSCTVSKTNLRRTLTSVTFTVTDVSKSGNTYYPALNHDPDGDSDGTVIVVNKP